MGRYLWQITIYNKVVLASCITYSMFRQLSLNQNYKITYLVYDSRRYRSKSVSSKTLLIHVKPEEIFQWAPMPCKLQLIPCKCSLSFTLTCSGDHFWFISCSRICLRHNSSPNGDDDKQRVEKAQPKMVECQLYSHQGVCSLVYANVS